MALDMDRDEKRKLRFAIRDYNKAIKARRAKNERNGLSYLNDYLPDEYEYSTVESLINTEEDYDFWVGTPKVAGLLERVLDSYDPHALDVIKRNNGVMTTNFADEMMRESKERARKERERQTENMAKELYPGDKVYDIDNMSEAERATLYANNDLIPDDVGEHDSSVEDVDEQTKWKWNQEDELKWSMSGSLKSRYSSYRFMWVGNGHARYPGYSDALDALDWLYDNRPDVLEKMFNSGDDEMQLDYLYINPKSDVYANIPFDERHANVVSYLTRQAIKAGMDTSLEWKKEDDDLDLEMFKQDVKQRKMAAKLASKMR